MNTGLSISRYICAFIALSIISFPQVIYAQSKDPVLLTKKAVCKQAAKIALSEDYHQIICKSAGVLDFLFARYETNNKSEVVTESEVNKCEEEKDLCLKKIKNELVKPKSTFINQCERRIKSKTLSSCHLSPAVFKDCQHNFITKITETNQKVDCESGLKESASNLNKPSNGDISSNKIQKIASCEEIKDKCPRIAKLMGM